MIRRCYWPTSPPAVSTAHRSTWCWRSSGGCAGSVTRTIVLVTHDEAVASAADRIVHMVDGKVVTGDGVAPAERAPPAPPVTEPSDQAWRDCESCESGCAASLPLRSMMSANFA